MKFFTENGLKVERIAAGNYHCVALCDDGNLYTWGRGIYGVLGNGSNQQALTPLLNEEFQFIANEAKEEGRDFFFKKIDAADDFTAVVLNDGTLFAWGKNDRGQLGVGNSIGIDLVESENIPREVNFAQALPIDQQSTPVMVTDVSTGNNTMIVKDSENRVYKTGLKIDYSPKLVALDPEMAADGKIAQLACGTAHYVILDRENNMHCFGKIFKEKPVEEHDGFGMYDADSIFDGGKILNLSMKYEIFGALIKD